MATPKTVAILGGGVGGVVAARALRRSWTVLRRDRGGKPGFGGGDFYAEPTPAVDVRAPVRRLLGKVLFEKSWRYSKL